MFDNADFANFAAMLAASQQIGSGSNSLVIITASDGATYTLANTTLASLDQNSFFYF